MSFRKLARAGDIVQLQEFIAQIDKYADEVLEDAFAPVRRLIAGPGSLLPASTGGDLTWVGAYSP